MKRIYVDDGHDLGLDESPAAFVAPINSDEDACAVIQGPRRRKARALEERAACCHEER